MYSLPRTAVKSQGDRVPLYYRSGEIARHTERSQPRFELRTRGFVNHAEGNGVGLLIDIRKADSASRTGEFGNDVAVPFVELGESPARSTKFGLRNIQVCPTNATTRERLLNL